MTFLSHRLLASLALLLLTAPLSAAVIQRDWQTPGDGLLTFDTVNRREWLDLPLTRISTFPGGYLEVVAETGPGGMFDGFTAAKSDDVLALAESAGMDTSMNDYGVNSNAANKLITLVEATFFFGEIKASVGFLDEVNVAPNLSGRLVASIGNNGQQAGISFYTESSASFDPGSITPFTGVWLYRQVPEPQGMILLLCSLAFLLAQKHRPFARCSF